MIDPRLGTGRSVDLESISRSRKFLMQFRNTWQRQPRRVGQFATSRGACRVCRPRRPAPDRRPRRRLALAARRRRAVFAARSSAERPVRTTSSADPAAVGRFSGQHRRLVFIALEHGVEIRPTETERRDTGPARTVAANPWPQFRVDVERTPIDACLRHWVARHEGWGARLGGTVPARS